MNEQHAQLPTKAKFKSFHLYGLCRYHNFGYSILADRYPF